MKPGGVPKSIFDAVYALATKPRHVCLIGLTSVFASMVRTLEMGYKPRRPFTRLLLRRRTYRASSSRCT
jgi:hypothetical protein